MEVQCSTVQYSAVLYLVHLIDEQNDIKYEDYANKMGSATIGTAVVDTVDKSPKVYTQLAREGVVLTQDSDNI